MLLLLPGKLNHPFTRKTYKNILLISEIRWQKNLPSTQMHCEGKSLHIRRLRKNIQEDERIQHSHNKHPQTAKDFQTLLQLV
jgi:hypothetical protein